HLASTSAAPFTSGIYVSVNNATFMEPASSQNKEPPAAFRCRRQFPSLALLLVLLQKANQLLFPPARSLPLVLGVPLVNSVSVLDAVLALLDERAHRLQRPVRLAQVAEQIFRDAVKHIQTAHIRCHERTG